MKKFLCVVLVVFASCQGRIHIKSTSGVSKASLKIEPTATFEGKKVTTEQFNILTRARNDAKITAMKHLYVISAMSGDCILYSTVKGKVTSSGKRLSPYSVSKKVPGMGGSGIPIVIGDKEYETQEVLQDDGTYGSSIHYLYWFDARGVMHKHYVSGGQIIHVSDQPMRFPKIILNLEQQAK